ncbi:SRPBCC family protein [Micromonospora sp. 4G57]|nr:SRPBCC family protein [Micromonospora sp. 4G57]MDZ5446665.1 SRPBCC family protein [Micromonospora sp. 4G57]
MRGTSSRPRAHNAVEARVTIRRPVREVFAFYRDFTNLPRFLGDVMAVEQVGPAVSRWTIQGPLGVRFRSTMRVTEERRNEVIGYETRSLPGLRTYWEVHFTSGPAVGETEVREVMRTPLGRLGHLVLALMGKPPAGEVPANLRRLKEVLETGRVTSLDHSVAGKFG